MPPSMFEVEEQTQLVTKAARAVSYEDLRRARAWFADIVLQHPGTDAAETAQFRGSIVNAVVQQMESSGKRRTRTHRKAWEGLMAITSHQAPDPLSLRTEGEGLKRSLANVVGGLCILILVVSALKACGG